MNNHEQKQIFLVFIIILLLEYLGLAYPSYNTEGDCRYCHGINLADRHHRAAYLHNIGCTNCHQVKYDNSTEQYYTEVIRDCLVCHPGENHENCITCHGTDYTGASPTANKTLVSILAFNESVHQDINSTPISTINAFDCWTCHYNRDMNRQNVNKCNSCHRKPSQWHGYANITTNLSELW